MDDFKEKIYSGYTKEQIEKYLEETKELTDSEKLAKYDTELIMAAHHYYSRYVKKYLDYTAEEIEKYLEETRNLTNEEIKKKYDVELILAAVGYLQQTCHRPHRS